MIIDKIDNWKKYPYGRAWEIAFNFLSNLQRDAEEKYYYLEEENIFARIMSYNTIDPEVAKIEAHHKYIDIQSPMIHSEGIGWYPSDDLKIISDYNKEKDVYWLSSNKPSTCKVDLFPGTFAMFSPKDAHQPKLVVDSTINDDKKSCCEDKKRIAFLID